MRVLVILGILIGVSLACTAETPTPTPTLSYLSVVSPVLGSIADARDAFREASLQRSRAIARLLDDPDPDAVRRAIESEMLALDSLLGVLMEAMEKLESVTPPQGCESIHALLIEATQLEQQGWEQTKLWLESPPDDQLGNRARETLAEASAIRDDATDELLRCVID